jgi:phosphatidylinositol glycan class W
MSETSPAINMTEKAFLKHAKENFVSNHTGGSLNEITTVTAVALVTLPPL